MKKLQRGFTLIELLVVIAILGVLAAGIVVAINPADKIKAATDAQVQSDIGSIATATESFAANNGGFYPAAQADLVPNELKALRVQPAGYTVYTFTALPAGCTAALKTCTSVVVSNQLKSSKYTATLFWVWCSSTGKAGATSAATVCP